MNDKRSLIEPYKAACFAMSHYKLLYAMEVAMNLSVRHFIIDGEDLIRVSQKKMKDFYFRKENSMLEYAGKLIQFVDVYVKIIDKKPVEIVRVNCMKYQVNSQGGQEKSYESSYTEHVSNLLFPPEVKSSDNVVNASEFFDAKKLSNKHTFELSKKAKDKISEILNIR